MSAYYPVIAALFGAVALLLLARYMRGKWDLLASHARDLMRHALSLLLMTGTLAGTVSTFSNGRLTLAGWAERIASVVGIALALELGCIYCGWYISQLDARILTARRKDQAVYLKRYRKQVLGWFVATLSISVVANLIFRVQQLGNWPLAIFASIAPALLIVLFTIILRTLPADYQEKRRQAIGRALLHLTEDAERTLQRGMRDLAHGGMLSEARQAALRLAVGFLRMGAQAEEQHNLDYMLTNAGGAQGGAVVDAEIYWSSKDIRSRYPISDRTAQDWMKNTPGRRKAARGNAWEVPASGIIRGHGEPVPQLPEPQRAQNPASEPQASAAEPLYAAYKPQTEGGISPL